MMNKSAFILTMACLSFTAVAAPKSQFLSLNSQIYNSIKNQIGFAHNPLTADKNVTVIKVDAEQVEKISSTIHHSLKRCGGFSAHESLMEAQKSFNITDQSSVNPLIEYVINQKNLVRPMVKEVNEYLIWNTINVLSNYKNRYYTSKSGIESAGYIESSWKDLTKHRSDIKVEIFKHRGFPQPSVIMTITGSEKPDEHIVLGAHLDSIVHNEGYSPSASDTAPGADDNASGVASITEVVRVLMDHDYKPKRTILIIGYAAEEVGLLGSQEIARAFKKKKSNVVGVMQLDMTLFKGTEDKDIILISDYTNKAQNTFLGKLIDEYVKVPWGYSQCGYGCSDHASWSAQGYPASFPFESNFDSLSLNPYVHTENDKLESYGNSAAHAVRFTQLATAFVVEMTD